MAAPCRARRLRAGQCEGLKGGEGKRRCSALPYPAPVVATGLWALKNSPSLKFLGAAERGGLMGGCGAERSGLVPRSCLVPVCQLPAPRRSVSFAGCPSVSVPAGSLGRSAWFSFPSASLPCSSALQGVLSPQQTCGRLHPRAPSTVQTR